ncbi:hypothetical protein BVX99_02450, partial [bacterium F16]
MATPLYAGSFIEDSVQELETLIDKNYTGRARELALKRLDRLISGNESEDIRIKNVKAYRRHLLDR